MISRRLFLGGLAAAPVCAVPLARAFIRDAGLEEDGAQPDVVVGLQGYLEDRLSAGLRQQIESQCLHGNGAPR